MIPVPFPTPKAIFTWLEFISSTVILYALSWKFNWTDETYFKALSAYLGLYFLGKLLIYYSCQYLKSRRTTNDC